MKEVFSGQETSQKWIGNDSEQINGMRPPGRLREGEDAIVRNPGFKFTARMTKLGVGRAPRMLVLITEK